MKKGTRMIDIAERLNISVVTVSNALNDRGGVSPELREMIKKTADKIGYQYENSGKNPGRTETQNIGLLIVECGAAEKSRLYWQISQCISSELIKQNMFAMNETLNIEAEHEGIIPRIVSEHKISALVVLGTLSEEYTLLLRKHNIPLLFVDSSENSFGGVDSVVIDSFHGTCLITEKLIKSGHSKIGFVEDAYLPSWHDKFLGYKKALMKNNIHFCNEWRIKDRMVSEIPALDRDNMPTAFVCENDTVAMRTIYSLRKLGINVPEEVSVVGFGNELSPDICDPPLTTVGINLPALAETTVSIIEKKLDNFDYSAGTRFILGGIIERESVQNI